METAVAGSSGTPGVSPHNVQAPLTALQEGSLSHRAVAGGRADEGPPKAVSGTGFSDQHLKAGSNSRQLQLIVKQRELLTHQTAALETALQASDVRLVQVFYQPAAI